MTNVQMPTANLVPPTAATPNAPASPRAEQPAATFAARDAGPEQTKPANDLPSGEPKLQSTDDQRGAESKAQENPTRRTRRSAAKAHRAQRPDDSKAAKRSAKILARARKTARRLGKAAGSTAGMPWAKLAAADPGARVETPFAALVRRLTAQAKTLGESGERPLRPQQLVPAAAKLVRVSHTQMPGEAKAAAAGPVGEPAAGAEAVARQAEARARQAEALTGTEPPDGRIAGEPAAGRAKASPKPGADPKTQVPEAATGKPAAARPRPIAAEAGATQLTASPAGTAAAPGPRAAARQAGDGKAPTEAETPTPRASGDGKFTRVLSENGMKQMAVRGVWVRASAAKTGAQPAKTGPPAGSQTGPPGPGPAVATVALPGAGVSAAREPAAGAPGEPIRVPLAAQLAESVPPSLRPGQQVVVRLYPPELGRVRVSLHADGQEVRGVLEVDNPRTFVELQRQTAALAERLADSGVDVRRLEVQLNDQSRQDLADPAAQDGGGRQDVADGERRDAGENAADAAGDPGAPQGGEGGGADETDGESVNVWI